MTECAGCRRPIRRSRILGWIHTDGTYWCFPRDNPGDLTASRAHPTDAFIILGCASARERYGY